MTYGSDETGKATFTLSPEEHEAFKAGKPVVKATEDCVSTVRIILKAYRPRLHKVWATKDEIEQGSQLYNEGGYPNPIPGAPKVKDLLKCIAYIVGKRAGRPMVIHQAPPSRRRPVGFYYLATVPKTKPQDDHPRLF